MSTTMKIRPGSIMPDAVQIDHPETGEPIDIGPAVSGVALRLKPGQLPEVTLDLLVHVRPVELSDPQIVIPEQTKQALEALGWLPPEQAAELAEYRKAATFWEGPQECLERECEDYFTEEGDERAGLDQCSHVVVKTLTPEQVNATLMKLADDDGLVWDDPEAAR